jgi:putative membrane protein
VIQAAGAWSYVVPVLMVMSGSMCYEMIEWAAAMVFGGELGMAYLGTQGDLWDAHKDMACAIVGALASMLLLAAIRPPAYRL